MRALGEGETCCPIFDHTHDTPRATMRFSIAPRTTSGSRRVWRPRRGRPARCQETEDARSLAGCGPVSCFGPSLPSEGPTAETWMGKEASSSTRWSPRVCEGRQSVCEDRREHEEEERHTNTFHHAICELAPAPCGCSSRSAERGRRPAALSWRVFWATMVAATAPPAASPAAPC